MDNATFEQYREQAEHQGRQHAKAKGENPKHPGETGELGENPSTARATGRANAGESGAKKANFAPFTEYESPEYPIHALGPLKDVATVTSRLGQIDPATAGQCVLGAAALLVQGTANVQTLSGRKPLSLFLASIMDSGDGKTTGEAIGLDAVKKHERAETIRQKQAFELAEFESREQNGGKVRVTDMPCERSPYRLIQDATVEGVRRSFVDGLPSQGAFTSEAAVMLCGWGMSADNRAKTAGTLNGLWDDGMISVMRGTSGRTQLFNRRFSAHWMIQPDAAHEAIHDPLLANIGFWPRFLIAWPAPMKPRKAQVWKWWEDATVSAYWARCRELLAVDMGEEIADVRTIPYDSAAYALAAKFFERMEVEARTATGKLRDVKPFAVRATEQAFRIAGVLTAFEGGDCIGAERMRDGITLASYSLDTWRGIFGARLESDHARWARLLHAWMLKQANGTATETAMLKLATPKELRQKHRRDVALGWLQRNELVERAMELDGSGNLRPVPNTWRAL